MIVCLVLGSKCCGVVDLGLCWLVVGWLGRFDFIWGSLGCW